MTNGDGTAAVFAGGLSYVTNVVVFVHAHAAVRDVA